MANILENCNLKFSEGCGHNLTVSVQCRPEPRRFISSEAILDLCSHFAVQPTKCHNQCLSDETPSFIFCSCEAALSCSDVQDSLSSSTSNMLQSCKSTSGVELMSSDKLLTQLTLLLTSVRLPRRRLRGKFICN